MKKKALITLLAALTAGSFLLLNGCGTDQPATSDSAVSAEAEAENLAEGTVQMHSVWYNTDNNFLPSATVTILDGRDELFSGTTDESGNLEACNLPGNTTLTCRITSSTGDMLAEGDVVFQISDDYESLTIYPVRDGENSEHILEIPTDKTVLRAAVFITEDGAISFANLSPYDESSSTSDNTAENGTSGDTAADQTATDAGQTQTDGAAADTGQGQTDGAEQADNASGTAAGQGAQQ